MYYSELVPGLRDLKTFNEFKDIRIRPLVSGQIEKLYNMDEGSAFYMLLGMLFIDSIKDFDHSDVDQGLSRLYREGKNRLDLIEVWASTGKKITTDVKLALGMVLAWQCDASYTTINGHRLFSTVNGSYATNGEPTWSNYLIPGQVWARQREETILYVRDDHPVMDNQQFRIIIRDVINQIRKLYRQKSYMEFTVLLDKCREFIKRG